MIEEPKEAANANQSFYELLYNPKKSMFQRAIFATMRLAHASDVPRSTMAEVLFDNAMDEVVPKGEMNQGKANIWYGQLLRFRDKIDAKIAEIENAS